MRAVLLAAVLLVAGCDESDHGWNDPSVVEGWSATYVKKVCRPPYSCVVMAGLEGRGGLWCERADCNDEH